jgi:hypothetical protein
MISPGRRQNPPRSSIPGKNGSIAVDFSRTYMKQVVAIHQAMFEKLLFDEDAAVSLDLAELFHDAGRTYLQISERINETCLFQRSLQD